jgi:hypothetical protein
MLYWNVGFFICKHATVRSEIYFWKLEFMIANSVAFGEFSWKAFECGEWWMFGRNLKRREENRGVDGAFGGYPVRI